MPELNPLSNDQIFLKKIAENTGSDYNTGDVSGINPLTIDQILLKEIAANTAGGGSGEITDLKNTVGVMLNVNGSKNILPNNATSKTENNVTFTVNSDGSVTVSTSGPASNTTELNLITANTDEVYKIADLVLSGCPSGGSQDTYSLNYRIGNASDDSFKEVIRDTGNGANCRKIEDGENLTVQISVKSGSTINTPITFYPMLRDARITDPTYVPYAMTTRELTEDTIVITATPSQSDYIIPYPAGFTLDNSMIVAAQYNSSTRGFPAFDSGSSTFPMPYYHTAGIVVNPSNVDTTLYTKLVICLKKIR